MSPTRNYSSAGALDSRGFTIVELLIGLFLAMLLTGAMLLSYTFLVRSLIRSSNQQQLEAQSRKALQMFAQDVRMATDIPSSSSQPSHTPFAQRQQRHLLFRYGLCLQCNRRDLPSHTSHDRRHHTVTLPYTTTAAGTLTRIYADHTSGFLRLSFLRCSHGVSNFGFNYLDKQGLPVDTIIPSASNRSKSAASLLPLVLPPPAPSRATPVPLRVGPAQQTPRQLLT